MRVLLIDLPSLCTIHLGTGAIEGNDTTYSHFIMQR